MRKSCYLEEIDIASLVVAHTALHLNSFFYFRRRFVAHRTSCLYVHKSFARIPHEHTIFCNCLITVSRLCIHALCRCYACICAEFAGQELLIKYSDVFICGLVVKLMTWNRKDEGSIPDTRTSNSWLLSFSSCLKLYTYAIWMGKRSYESQISFLLEN